MLIQRILISAWNVRKILCLWDRSVSHLRIVPRKVIIQVVLLVKLDFKRTKMEIVKILFLIVIGIHKIIDALNVLKTTHWFLFQPSDVSKRPNLVLSWMIVGPVLDAEILFKWFQITSASTIQKTVSLIMKSMESVLNANKAISIRQSKRNVSYCLLDVLSQLDMAVVQHVGLDMSSQMGNATNRSRTVKCN